MKYLLALLSAALLSLQIHSQSAPIEYENQDHNVEVIRSFDFSLVSAITSVILVKFKFAKSTGSQPVYYHAIQGEYADNLIHIDVSASNNGNSIKVSRVHSIPA